VNFCDVGHVRFQKVSKQGFFGRATSTRLHTTGTILEGWNLTHSNVPYCLNFVKKNNLVSMLVVCIFSKLNP